MIEEAGPREPRGRKMPLLGWVVTLALAVGGLSTGCAAAELGPARPAGLPELLASVTILSDAAMANEKRPGCRSRAS